MENVGPFPPFPQARRRIYSPTGRVVVTNTGQFDVLLAP